MNIDPKRERWIAELIETFFAAFDKRPMPNDRFVSLTYDDPRLEVKLRSIDRRDISRDIVEEMDLYPDEWMAFMTNEGRLHYLPVLMSLSLQDFYDPAVRYGGLDYSILTKLLPWFSFSSPHEWLEIVRWDKEDTLNITASLVNHLFDTEFYFNHGGGNLLLTLEPQEKEALKSYVENHPDMGRMYPLFVYGIYEILDGRVEVGDCFSWLPKHEKKAVLDFIDFLTNERQTFFSKVDLNRMLEVRNSNEEEWQR